MRLQKILAAVQPASTEAEPIRTALELASRAGARLAVVSVTEGPGSPTGPAALALGRRLRPLIEPRLRDRVTAHAAFGLPAVEIPRWAEREGADLIVLGRASALGGPEGGGDTVGGTVRRARVPCLVAPAGRAAFRRVLAAVDGGPASRDVLDVATGVSVLWGAQLRVLRVEQPALAGALVSSGAHVPAPERRGVPPGWPSADGGAVLVREGDPATEILRAAREEDADLLVFGHHRGSAGTAVAGGVAARLLRRAPCAVLTVPI